MRQGAADYITKPINPDLIRNRLARIAEQKRLALAKGTQRSRLPHYSWKRHPA